MQWDRGQGLREIQGPELPALAFTMAKPGSHRGARGDGRTDGQSSAVPCTGRASARGRKEALPRVAARVNPEAAVLSERRPARRTNTVRPHVHEVFRASVPGAGGGGGGEGAIIS